MRNVNLTIPLALTIWMRRFCGSVLLVTMLNASVSSAAPKAVECHLSNTGIDAWDFIELTLKVSDPDATNPFTDVTVGGEFGRADDSHPSKLPGFCDATDGSLYRLRFMAASAGDYTYAVHFQQGGFLQTFRGAFKASAGRRRGALRVDPAYPWHFIWAGTGEHYFWNGTTAFLLMGWEDDQVIRDVLDRYHRWKINRVRVLLNGRAAEHFATEPVESGHGFHLYVNPWPAQRPADRVHAGFDFARFDLAYWAKFERMLRYARDRDIIISVILDWNDSKEHPAAGSADEWRYYRYAVARLGAFANITWELGDDLDSFRDAAWAHATGTLLTHWDNSRHLATSHPVNNDHQDRAAEWFGMTSLQEWHRPLHVWMLEQRRKQAQIGRLIPQVNEEYGYEDHYPDWNPTPAPGCSADGNRRAAWEMAMAGTYQTTGETAKRGTGVAPDTGGGWVNGRADATMQLLELQSHLVEFFTAFDWWKTEPHDELVNHGAFCLSQPGQIYATYLPHGGNVSVKLAPGDYRANWFHARTGETIDLGTASAPGWTSPKAPDLDDWALLLRKVTIPR